MGCPRKTSTTQTIECANQNGRTHSKYKSNKMALTHLAGFIAKKLGTTRNECYVCGTNQYRNYGVVLQS